MSLVEDVVLVDDGDSNAYGVNDSLVDVGTVIDPLPEADKVYLTHCHPDHIAVLKPYVENTDANVYVHEDGWNFLEENEDEYRRFASAMGYDPDFYDVEVEFIEDGDEIDLGGYSAEVLHTPGHSPGSVSFYVPEEKAVFSGDVVFGNGSPGRTDLPGGDRQVLRNSISRLAELDVDHLYAGHLEPVHGEIGSKMKLAMSLV